MEPITMKIGSTIVGINNEPFTTPSQRFTANVTRSLHWAAYAFGLTKTPPPITELDDLQIRFARGFAELREIAVDFQKAQNYSHPVLDQLELDSTNYKMNVLVNDKEGLATIGEFETFEDKVSANEHVHPSNEMLYLVKGRAIVRLGDLSRFDLRPGDYMHVVRGTAHSVEIAPNSKIYFLLHPSSNDINSNTTGGSLDNGEQGERPSTTNR